ncbi:hypothetical protein JRQ81_012118 [Phrynocephalus forsythii]|uniref:Uncharacterized protein n=1 Tax=Phrynocephalus forsythii TaxID=171643 RepID=A0A9Q0X5M4_9SAUR|nr:hypothetical protein JRQ81_012118 [Phrynocephalus forsythii]
MAKAEVDKAKTKHVSLRYQNIKDAVQRKIIELKYCPSEDMVADILTKALGSEKHYQMMGKLETLQDLLQRNKLFLLSFPILTNQNHCAWPYPTENIFLQYGEDLFLATPDSDRCVRLIAELLYFLFDPRYRVCQMKAQVVQQKVCFLRHNLTHGKCLLA